MFGASENDLKRKLIEGVVVVAVGASLEFLKYNHFFAAMSLRVAFTDGSNPGSTCS